MVLVRSDAPASAAFDGNRIGWRRRGCGGLRDCRFSLTQQRAASRAALVAKKATTQLVASGHIKTTIELSDALLAEAKKVAASEGITMDVRPTATLVVSTNYRSSILSSEERAARR
jgi:hypothetical protein